MAKLVWDKVGDHFYETGTDHGVLYPMDDEGKYGKGVVWNGLTSVSESPSGAESNKQYADNIAYLDLVSAEEFGATIEAFNYPAEFGACNGEKALSEGVMAGQQTRKRFGFSYRTKLGNDIVGEDYGYKLHLVYNALASPSERSYSTINDSPEAITMSWEISTTPVEIGTGYKPTAIITIDSTKADATKLASLEEMLYGKEGTGDDSDPKLPTPAEVLALFKAEG